MKIIFGFFSLLLLVFCNTKTESSYNVFEEDSWHADSIITLNHNVVDSTTKHNLYLKLDTLRILNIKIFFYLYVFKKKETL